jgi:hypothetical protein
VRVPAQLTWRAIVSDEGDLTEGDEPTGPRARKRQGRSLDTLAMRDLRTARKLFKEGGSAESEATFLVAMANVLATLDLASAIRESNGGASDD